MIGWSLFYYQFQFVDHTCLFLSQSQVYPEDLANQSVRLKEEQLRREEEKVNCTVSPSTDFL